MRGFTLIELLVCIAVICLLIGLLLPALAQVKMTAQSDVCKEQLHDSAMGLHSFMNDHQMLLPLAEQGMDASAQPPQLVFSNQMSPYFSDVPPPSMDRKVKPWVCPLDTERAPYTGSSYRYVAGAYEQHSTTYLPADPGMVRGITLQYEQHPDWAIMTDFDWWHVKDHAEGGRRFEVCFDGHVFGHKIIAWYSGFISLDPWE